MDESIRGLRRLTVPFVIDQPMNATIFKTSVERCLAPTLEPGDIVVLDNLSSHKSRDVRDIIDACGANLVFLPPYAPDLNRNQQMFAKLKALPRKDAGRSPDALWRITGRLLDRFPCDECRNYFQNSGYDFY